MSGGIPVILNDSVSDTQTQGAATCSNGSAVRVGMERVMGLQNGELAVVEVGDLEAKDAGHYRIKWYASHASLLVQRSSHRCCLCSEPRVVVLECA